jgi:hypothetical protein
MKKRVSTPIKLIYWGIATILFFFLSGFPYLAQGAPLEQVSFHSYLPRSRNQPNQIWLNPHAPLARDQPIRKKWKPS